MVGTRARKTEEVFLHSSLASNACPLHRNVSDFIFTNCCASLPTYTVYSIYLPFATHRATL